MAGDWIKWECGLADKPEVIEMATLLHMDRRDVAGRLMHLWEWVSAATKNGRIRGATKSFVDERVGVDSFSDFLELVGWLRVEKSALYFPKFHRHNSKSAKARSLALLRKRKERSQMSRAQRDQTTPRDRDRGRDRDKSKTPLPPELDTDAFKSAWKDWLEYRKQSGRKKYTDIGQRRQLSRLEKWGHERAIAAIELSIANEWKGIHEGLGAGPGQRSSQGRQTAQQRERERGQAVEELGQPRLL